MSDLNANFKTTSIKFSSRSSIKLGDSYYTFESTIEKSCPENCTKEEYDDAKDELWKEVNGEVDMQLNEIIEAYKKAKNKK